MPGLAVSAVKHDSHPSVQTTHACRRLAVLLALLGLLAVSATDWGSFAVITHFPVRGFRLVAALHFHVAVRFLIGHRLQLLWRQHPRQVSFSGETYGIRGSRTLRSAALAGVLVVVRRVPALDGQRDAQFGRC